MVNSLVSSIRKAKADDGLQKTTAIISVPMKQAAAAPASPTRGTIEDEAKADPNVVKMPAMRRRSSIMQRSVDSHDLDVIRKLSGIYLLAHSLSIYLIDTFLHFSKSS